ncbi:MFS transporter [Yinghuangia seranimata]|uniref:MFS transporter n=1 Tax=Yinghuangia seranimata TaxID=408067 RepID=UPI00248B9C1B|nr:MFS transporter [Yinghuangia seranimata]MDI2127471.1 MFS transporter [Yinghuangia seranimata]
MNGEDSPGGSRYVALAAMLFAVSMTFIDQSIVSIAAPDMVRELGLSASGVQWVVNAYLLALAATFALGGRLSDTLGHRRMALIGIVVFVAASALCGAAPTGDAAQAWLIGFRVAQGVGGALMFPAALAIVVSVFPVAERGRALALFFGLSGGLTALGPILGGWLTQWTWRAIFWVNVPVGIVAVVLTLRAHIRTAHRHEPLDWRGAVLIAAGMALSVLGLQQAQDWGWHSAATWGCIVGGLALLAVFVAVELHTKLPLIRIRVFRDRAFAVDNAVLFFAMTAFVPVFFFASVYAQVALGSTAGEAGLYLLVFVAGFGPASQLGGRILDKRGAKPTVLRGALLAAAGFALWAHTATDLSLGAQWPYIVMAGAGIGLLLGPASTDAVNRSIGASYGEVTGITQTVRNYASSLGFAALGTLLTHQIVDGVTETLHGAGLTGAEAGDVAHGIAKSISGAGGGHDTAGGASDPVGALVQRVWPQIQADYAEATQAVLYAMAAALAVAFLVALLHPGTRVTDEGGGVEEGSGADAGGVRSGPAA